MTFDMETEKKLLLERHELTERRFSREYSKAREKWAVFNFFQCLGIDARIADMKSEEENSIVDVEYPGFSFQVKELMEDDRKRTLEHQIYKDKLLALTTEEELKELILATGTDVEYPSIDSFVRGLEKDVVRISRKYSVESRSTTDLLLYCNYREVWGIEGSEAPVIDSCGWRSVSIVKGSWAIVLSASDNASAVITELVGSVVESTNWSPDLEEFL